MLTERENRYCVEISHRVARMRSFLSTNNLKEPPDPTGLFEFLLSLRQIQGNLVTTQPTLKAGDWERDLETRG